MQSGETQHGSRNSNRGEAGMSSRRIRAAVIHRRAEGHAGRHLVVEQTARFETKCLRHIGIKRIVLSRLSSSRCSRSGCLRATRVLGASSSLSRTAISRLEFPKASTCIEDPAFRNSSPVACSSVFSKRLPVAQRLCPHPNMRSGAFQDLHAPLERLKPIARRATLRELAIGKSWRLPRRICPPQSVR